MPSAIIMLHSHSSVELPRPVTALILSGSGDPHSLDLFRDFPSIPFRHSSYSIQQSVRRGGVTDSAIGRDAI